MTRRTRATALAVAVVAIGASTGTRDPDDTDDGPHETVQQRFTSPGTSEGSCNVHPSGEVRVEVVA